MSVNNNQIDPIIPFDNNTNNNENKSVSLLQTIKNLLEDLCLLFTKNGILPVVGIPEGYFAVQNNDFYSIEQTVKDGIGIAKFTSNFGSNDQPHPTVIFCHGNDASYSYVTYQSIYDFYTRRGIDVVTFDYSGTGYSQDKGNKEDKRCRNEYYRSADVAYAYAIEEAGVPKDKIFVHGYSMGGPAAAYLAEKHEGMPLLLDRTFARVCTMVNDVAKNNIFGYILFPLRWMLAGMAEYGWGLAVEDHIQNVKGKWIIISGSEDKGMNENDLHHSQRIFDRHVKSKNLEEQQKNNLKELSLYTLRIEHFTTFEHPTLGAAVELFVNEVV